MDVALLTVVGVVAIARPRRRPPRADQVGLIPPLAERTSSRSKRHGRGEPLRIVPVTVLS